MITLFLISVGVAVALLCRSLVALLARIPVRNEDFNIFLPDGEFERTSPVTVNSIANGRLRKKAPAAYECAADFSPFGYSTRKH